MYIVNWCAGFQTQVKIRKALKLPGIQRYRHLVRSAIVWELLRALAYCACDEGFGGTHCEISMIHISFNGQNESSFLSPGTASALALTAGETFTIIAKAVLLIHVPRTEPVRVQTYGLSSDA
ncbi:hypothetical protein NECAME_11827 [Necator americanus]|uniref:EGF-like domain-containing protein n=1 Tax=Necator americanus TaxID=51031 RepID=W2T2K1_NECAM|nr:hypothetical protein NECAME_11827 [Necator americanus]ETN76235.1 hypothetical protein NECAME_11827 [Necator americanus]